MPCSWIVDVGAEAEGLVGVVLIRALPLQPLALERRRAALRDADDGADIQHQDDQAEKAIVAVEIHCRIPDGSRMCRARGSAAVAGPKPATTAADVSQSGQR